MNMPVLSAAERTSRAWVRLTKVSSKEMPPWFGPRPLSMNLRLATCSASSLIASSARRSSPGNCFLVGWSRTLFFLPQRPKQHRVGRLSPSKFRSVNRSRANRAASADRHTAGGRGILARPSVLSYLGEPLVTGRHRRSHVRGQRDRREGARGADGPERRRGVVARSSGRSRTEHRSARACSRAWACRARSAAAGPRHAHRGRRRARPRDPTLDRGRGVRLPRRGDLPRACGALSLRFARIGCLARSGASGARCPGGRTTPALVPRRRGHVGRAGMGSEEPGTARARGHRKSRPHRPRAPLRVPV